MPSLDDDIESRVRLALDVTPMGSGTKERMLARLLPQVGARARRRHGALWPWLAALGLAALWTGMATASGAYLEIAAPVAATIVGSLMTAAAAGLAALLHTLGWPVAALGLVWDVSLLLVSRRIREVGL